VVALYHPHGTLAQVGPPERLLAEPADEYVAEFVGFDRGIRRLSFFPADALALSSGPVMPADATAASALRSGEPWLLVVGAGNDLRPRGWLAAGRLAGLDGETRLGDVAVDGFGHTFRVGDDSLRAALDAAVLSPAGQAVGVDSDGRVLGVASFDQLRAAVQAAREADDAAAGATP
jgi:osmoprotectant transport system ATP-binding protein